MGLRWGTVCVCVCKFQSEHVLGAPLRSENVCERQKDEIVYLCVCVCVCTADMSV